MSIKNSSGVRASYIYMEEVVEIQTAIPQRTFSVCRGDRMDIISIFLYIYIDAVAVSSSYYIMAMPNFGHCEVFFCFSPTFMSKLLTHGPPRNDHRRRK